METNYFTNMIDHVYTLLDQKYINWPEEMQSDEQRKLITKLIDYYSDKEDFEKCMVLQQKLRNIDAKIKEF